MPDKYVRQDSGSDATPEVTISREVTDGEPAEVVTEHRRTQIDGELLTEVTTLETRPSPQRNRNLIIVASCAALALVVLVLLLWPRNKPVAQEQASAEATQAAEE